MLRAVICGNIETDDGSALGTVLEQHAQAVGLGAVEVQQLDALATIDQATHPRGEAPLDLILLANILPGLSGIHVLSDIRRSGSQIRVVLFADDVEAAPQALELGASGFLPAVAPRASLDRTLKRVLKAVKGFHDESVLLKLRERPRRIQFRQLLYVETQGHDQTLHVVGGASYSIRSTSQVLFDQLQHDPAFFKAGSSYILNLRHVVSVGSGDGMVTLTDGTKISVPVRLRKALESALM